MANFDYILHGKGPNGAGERAKNAKFNGKVANYDTILPDKGPKRAGERAKKVPKLMKKPKSGLIDEKLASLVAGCPQK